MHKVEKIIEECYNQIANSDGIISVSNIKQKIVAKLGIQLSELEMQDYLNEHTKLLRITIDQFICRYYFEKIFWNYIAYKTTLEEVEDFLKEKYFILKEIKTEELLNDFLPSFLDFLNREENIAPLKVKRNNKLYEIKSQDDLIDFGIEEGYVSHEMVKEYVASYGLNEGDKQYEISLNLYEKSIDYSSNCGEQIIKESVDPGKNYFAMRNIDYNNQNNALLVDLRFNQLLALLILMNDKDKLKRKLKEASRSKYQRDLIRLKLINEDKLLVTERGANLARRVFEIADSFLDYIGREELRNNEYSISELSKSESIKFLQSNQVFLNKIAPYLREHYLSLAAVRLFVNWIKAINQQGKDSMFDIFEYLIENEHYEELEWLLIGDRPTCGKEPIKNETEICLSCDKIETLCLEERKLFNISDKDYLFKIRDELAKNYIKNMVENNYRKLKIPIYIKLLVPYSLVVRIKLFMRKIRLLKSDSKILYKETGDYCPYNDKWELDDNDILV